MIHNVKGKNVEEGILSLTGNGWLGAIDNLNNLNFPNFFVGTCAHGEGEGALGWVVDGVLVVLPHFCLLLVPATNDLDVSVKRL